MSDFYRHGGIAVANAKLCTLHKKYKSKKIYKEGIYTPPMPEYLTTSTLLLSHYCTVGNTLMGLNLTRDQEENHCLYFGEMHIPRNTSS